MNLVPEFREIRNGSKDFDFLLNGVVFGTLYKKVGPKPDEIRIVGRSLWEDTGIFPNEEEYVKWIAKLIDHYGGLEAYIKGPESLIEAKP